MSRSECPSCGCSQAATVSVASARDVAARWKHQYFVNGEWKSALDRAGKDVYDQLVELGPTPGVEMVCKIIGNKSWTHLSCSGCGDYVHRAVTFSPFGKKIYICEACARDAVAIYSEVKNGR